MEQPALLRAKDLRSQNSRCLRRSRRVGRYAFGSFTPDRRLNKGLRGNSQRVMQAPDHLEGKGALTV